MLTRADGRVEIARRSVTSEEAEALVRRLNASPATRVRFWSIGNEPLLRKPDLIQEVHAYLMRIAPAMKKADPTIEVFVFDECEMRAPAYEALCGGPLDITGKNPDGTWTRADQKHGRTGAARLKWGLTEANVTWANPDRRVEGFGNPSFVGGQFLAEVFGVGMELGAFTVAPWCISETDHAETDFGYLGLPPEFHPRSSYYHTQLMARHMGGSFVPSRTNEAKVKSIATRDGDGLAVMLLNQLQDRDLEYDLALSKDAPSTKPLAVRVDAGLAVKVAGWLPRETTTLLRLDGEGRPLLLYTYGRQHNVENQPPEVLALSPNAALPKASTPAPAAAAVPADSPQPPVPTLVPAGYAGSPFGDRRNPMAPQRIPGRLQCEEQGPGRPGTRAHAGPAPRARPVPGREHQPGLPRVPGPVARIAGRAAPPELAPQARSVSIRVVRSSKPAPSRASPARASSRRSFSRQTKAA